MRGPVSTCAARLMMWVAAACWLAAVSACAPQLGGMRINKVFTATFSRREADRLVASGRVAINGVRASNGDRVTAGDAVTLDGAPFSLPVAAELNNEDTGDAGHLCAAPHEDGGGIRRRAAAVAPAARAKHIS